MPGGLVPALKLAYVHDIDILVHNRPWRVCIVGLHGKRHFLEACRRKRIERLLGLRKEKKVLLVRARSL